MILVALPIYIHSAKARIEYGLSTKIPRMHQTTWVASNLSNLCSGKKTSTKQDDTKEKIENR